MNALLHVPGLVQQQHRAVAAEMVDHEPGHVVPDPVVVPSSARQESVHHRRGRVSDLLGDRPAVLARQLGQQPAHHPLRRPTRLDPAEPPGCLSHQVPEQRLGPARV